MAPHARHAKCLPVYGSWVLVRTVTGLKSAGVACICIRCPRILQSSGVVRAGCWHGPREILKSAESSHQTICIELPNLQSPNRTSPFHYIIPWSHFIASSPGPHQPPSFASSSQICKVRITPVHSIASCQGSAPAPEFRIGRPELYQVRDAPAFCNLDPHHVRGPHQPPSFASAAVKSFKPAFHGTASTAVKFYKPPSYT